MVVVFKLPNPNPTIFCCNMSTSVHLDAANQTKTQLNEAKNGRIAHMTFVVKKTSASDCFGNIHFKLTKCVPTTATAPPILNIALNISGLKNLVGC